MQINRRQFAALAALAVPSYLAPRATVVRGVDLGLQSYTFHMIRQGGLSAVDTMIATLKAVNLDLLELWAPQVEPVTLPPFYWAPFVGTAQEKSAIAMPTPEQRAEQRSRLREWRSNVPADYFPSIRRKFDSAGIRLFSYNYSFSPDMTEAEIDSGFKAAHGLGVNILTVSTKVSMAEKIAPFAEKHNMMVAWHNHSMKSDPDETATPESFAKLLSISKHYRINLDVAHFGAAGLDAASWLKEHHDVVTNLHVHDRKLGEKAESVPFGEGVSQSKECLLLLRDNHWKIPVMYELEYVGRDGRDIVQETNREFDYIRKVLNS